MQIPRGKFRSVIKGVALDSLLQELAEVQYTGLITISRKHEVISLVIQRGRYILAEYGSLRGDPAWEAINVLGEATIDAIIADFADAEMKLAVEFNEPDLLSPQIFPRVFRAPREEGKGSVPSEKAAEPPSIAPRLHPNKKAAASALETPEEAPGLRTKADTAHAGTTAQGPGRDRAPPRGGHDELALLHMEMSALDDVDVEHIATKIRKNAKGIVKKLHLGHLMTETED